LQELEKDRKKYAIGWKEEWTPSHGALRSLLNIDAEGPSSLLKSMV
jgi:hypothetical protein